MVYLNCDFGTLHCSAEVVPYIAISIGVGIVLNNHFSVIGISFGCHCATPTVGIRTEHKVLFVTGSSTICYFIGNGKVPVVPVTCA
ncbi:hypothetical protein SDC9_148870 [bioreactor metagenome]|uniref:Uncharacterized protein n=1 Tax=bioreactor metagenome TaxID=1076179 RepID=A0A645EK15_9ZZZZ